MTEARRSSIPILKQSNTTKTFQSYVNLHLSDETSNERKQNSSSSSLSSPTTLNVDPKASFEASTNDLNLTTDNEILIKKLLDENKRLKRNETLLVSRFEEGMIVMIF